MKINFYGGSLSNNVVGIAASNSAELTFNGTKVDGNVYGVLEIPDGAPDIAIEIPRDELIAIIRACIAEGPQAPDGTLATMEKAGISKWKQAADAGGTLARWIADNPDKLLGWIEVLSRAAGA